MARILVTEELAQSGISAMQQAGHEVDIRLGLSPSELLDVIPQANAVIIRSATKITADVLAAGTNLIVVGRAGIGLDNVDVAEATKRGVMVVNAPESNIISAAEQAMALLLAQARNLAQAHSGLVAGKWERSKWTGIELYGKTLGIIGLGRVGALVASRAAAFGMNLIGYDPYISSDRARQMGVEMKSLEELVSESDFVTIHLPKTPETLGLINKDILAKAKKGLRIINTARGGIIDEDALVEAIQSGQIGGAGLDVFATEPPTNSALLQLSQVTVTPHLGASTTEAQDKAGTTIAEQVILALAGDFVPFAVNVSAAEASETVRPFLPLAERLGCVFASLVEAVPTEGMEIECEGTLAGYNTEILTLATLKGFFSNSSEEPVSYVNAPQLAKERGLEIKESKTSATRDYVNLITIRGGGHSVSGTLAGVRAEQRIVMVDEHLVEVPPAENMLIVRNDDRPGMIGIVGTTLGKSGVSISNMAVGRSPQGKTALMVLSIDRAVDEDALKQLSETPGILEVHRIFS